MVCEVDGPKLCGGKFCDIDGLDLSGIDVPTCNGTEVAGGSIRKNGVRVGSEGTRLKGEGDCAKVNGVGLGLGETKGLGVEETTCCAVVCPKLSGVEGPKLCNIGCLTIGGCVGPNLSAPVVLGVDEPKNCG